MSTIIGDHPAAGYDPAGMWIGYEESRPDRKRSVRVKQVEHRVALVTSTSSFGRRILKGVSTYVRPTRPWVIHIGQSYLPDRIDQLRAWNPTGIIAHLGSAELVEQVRGWNIPLVNVSNATRQNDPPHVGIDDFAVGRMAAEHLIEKGLERFAFCGDLSRGYACDRRDGFRQVVTAAGHPYCEFSWPRDAKVFVAGAHHAMDTGVETAFRRWFENLPKPIGILVYQDYLGFSLCEVCRQAGLQIPEEIAMIGVDDDEMACDFAYPPMSSVRSPLEMVGYESARVLDDLFQGKPPPPTPILFAPTAVTVRQSTEITAANDPQLAAALRFIRNHADQPIQVEDVLDAVLISRRSLETKFKTLLNRTPLAEVHRVHVEQAKRLLTETRLPMQRVTESSGFSSTAQMNEVFRRHVGVSPSEYRRRTTQGG
jgi:LacI family transcriptional regulator